MSADQPIGTLSQSGLTAEIYSQPVPGEFKVVFRDGAGEIMEELPLTGVSTYRQREPEIRARMDELAAGKRSDAGKLADAGEY